MDEVSLSGPTRVIEWTGQRIVEYEIEPQMLGLPRRAAAEVAGGGPRENAELIRQVLGGASGAHRDIVLLNAALALKICGATKSLNEGFRRAADSIDSGAAQRKLASLVESER